MFFWKKKFWKRYLAFLLIIYPKKFVAGKESEIAKERDDEQINVCQRCFQPIRIDSPFYSMREQIHAELSLNFLPAPKIDVETSESKLDQYVFATKKGTYIIHTI